MPDTIHLPVLGDVRKGAAIAGILAAVAVGGYTYYRHLQKKAADTTGAYGYGATAYGYGAGAEAAGGYYGYGYAYGGIGGGAINPYPVGSEYGYGAFGYGYYNPYTGQFLGGGTGSGAGGGTGTGTGTGTGGGKQGGGGTGPPTRGTLHSIKANGKQDLYFLAKSFGISERELIELNPHLKHLQGTRKKIPNGTKVVV